MGTIATFESNGYRVYVPYTMQQQPLEAPSGCVDIDVVILGSWWWKGRHDVCFTRIGYRRYKDNMWIFSWRNTDKANQVLAWRLIRACLQGVSCKVDIPRSGWNGSNLDEQCVTIRLKPIGVAWEIFDFLPCIDPVDAALPLLYEE